MLGGGIALILGAAGEGGRRHGGAGAGGRPRRGWASCAGTGIRRGSSSAMSAACRSAICSAGSYCWSPSKGLWAPALILPFIISPMRALRSRAAFCAAPPFWQAHREHFYQRALGRDGNHAAVARMILLCDATLVALALLALAAPRIGRDFRRRRGRRAARSAAAQSGAWLDAVCSCWAAAASSEASLATRLAGRGERVIAAVRAPVALGTGIELRAIGAMSAATDWPALIGDVAAIVASREPLPRAAGAGRGGGSRPKRRRPPRWRTRRGAAASSASY